jgi:hypothetical protein
VFKSGDRGAKGHVDRCCVSEERGTWDWGHPSGTWGHWIGRAGHVCV